VAAGDEGVLEYLNDVASESQPFCLIVSIVNPHDVLLYPRNYEDSGYDDSWLVGNIGLPATVDEDLSTKPRVQEQFLRIMNLAGRLGTPPQKRNYLSFYGNLMRSTDAYLVKILDTLRARRLLDDTLVIRTADHGEMGLAHGGLRQKNFNFYEETMTVPLVYSNPMLFSRPRQSQALVSHVDFLPTLASMFNAPQSARADREGVDYSGLILDPGNRGVQDYTVFTYDDVQSGQSHGPIRSRRTTSWASARHAGSWPDTTTPPARSRRNSRCTTSLRTRWSATTLRARATGAPPSRIGSSSVCSASCRRSSRRACSRCPTRPSARSRSASAQSSRPLVPPAAGSSALA